MFITSIDICLSAGENENVLFKNGHSLSETSELVAEV